MKTKVLARGSQDSVFRFWKENQKWKQTKRLLKSSRAAILVLGRIPVILAHSVERQQFDYRQVRNYLAHSADGPSKLDCLLALSLALYQALNVNGEEFRNLRHSLGAQTLAREDFVEAFKSNGELNACGRPMSADRLKTTFQNYYLYGRQHGKETAKRVRPLGELL